MQVMDTKTLRGFLLGLLATLALVFALAMVMMPSVAYADSYDETAAEESFDEVSSDKESENNSFDHILGYVSQAVVQQLSQVNKVLPYDRTLIDQIGCQSTSGHGVCCPGYACAYGDAVLDGTVNSHTYYGCGNCRWNDWGGGNSAYRSVDNVLREAYDQILAGKPTVIHVGASYGQHWITLIGYKDVTDPNNLTLSNFIALDPWDASQLVAGDRFWLYGDGCEHISDR